MLGQLFFAKILIFCLLQLAQCNLEYDGFATIKLQHALEGGPNPQFTDRGNITITSLRLGQANVNDKPLTDAERVKLKRLAAQNDFYQLKSIVTTNDGSESVYISTVKACMLAQAELNDILSISLDYAGHILVVTDAVAATGTCEGANVPIEALKAFQTRVFVRHSLNGPTPDTATYIQKLEREREARERGEVKDNRSFLGKYWMYILPVVIIMVLSSATNPEASGGGGGGR